uniref:Uncharacterized protein n=1 Tax=Megaselia scalaris TaxID=36166 RepID=T1GPH0_MEGSC
MHKRRLTSGQTTKPFDGYFTHGALHISFANTTSQYDLESKSIDFGYVGGFGLAVGTEKVYMAIVHGHEMDNEIKVASWKPRTM